MVVSSLNEQLLSQLKQSQSRLQPTIVIYELRLDGCAIDGAFRCANGRCCASEREMWGVRRVMSWASCGVWDVVE